MRNLSICLISYEFPPRYGGEGSYTYSLFRALRAIGNVVTVIVPSECYAPQPEDARSILRIQSIKFPLMRTLSFSLLARKRAAHISRTEGVDVVHYTNDYVPIIDSKEQVGRPLVATIHHPHISEARAILGGKQGNRSSTLIHTVRKLLLHQVQRRGLTKADRIIAVSRFAATEAARVLQAPTDRLRVVMHGIDTNRFNPEIDSKEFRRRFSLSSSGTILYVGRLDFNKSLEWLMKSFSLVGEKVKDARLALVGRYGRGDRRRLLEYATRLGVSSRLTLLGPLSEHDLPMAYSATEVVVLPSFMEGFGLTLLESMASGKPCVASHVGGTPEVLHHGRTGLLVPVGDVEGLASALTDMLTDTALASRLGRAAREYAIRHFTLERLGLETMRVYQELLE